MKIVLSMQPKGAAGLEADDVVLLGGQRMPAATQEAEGSSNGPSAGRAIALLNEALDILDALGDCPELGARVQEVIDALEERRKPQD